MNLPTQFWVAELDQYNNPRLFDGAHQTDEKARSAIKTMELFDLVKDRRLAIAAVSLTEVAK